MIIAAVKNKTNVGQVLNFRVCMLLKHIVATLYHRQADVHPVAIN